MPTDRERPHGRVAYGPQWQENPYEKGRTVKQCGLLNLAEGQRFELWELLHSTVFKTVALNHSAILPMAEDINRLRAPCPVLKSSFYSSGWQMNSLFALPSLSRVTDGF